MNTFSNLNLLELTTEELYLYDGGRTAGEIGYAIGSAIGKAGRAVCDFCDGFAQGFKDAFMKK